ncbi:hypothetical protein ACFV20_13195 [Streptomyces sp. NPDC059696]|uniref:hypothetical protein n=1 Tax=Streptomyces sp. NPDC059696 TaxID=3346911 RepID=UPI00368B8F49
MSYELQAVIAVEERLRVVARDLAVVWESGAGGLGPLRVDEGEPFASDGSPVSQALRQLGAVARAGQDEFAAVGLDRHRHSEAWIG